MADEIAQVVDLEYKGVYYLLKGSKELIAKMCMMIRFLHEWNHKKWLEKPGSSTWQKIQEASEGSAPILEFPKEMFEETIDISHDPDVKGKGYISPFEYYCRKNNLRYCMMPDLNPNDDYIPVAVLSQEFGIHDEQIKAYMRRRIETEEDRDKGYEKKIDDAKKALENAEGSEKEKIEKDLAELTDAKEQNNALLQESKEKMERGNVLDFAEYIKQAEGTCVLSDPDKAKLQAETCGIVREYMPDECMYPIRDAGMIPEGKKVYYLQKCGEDSYISVERSFEVDEKGCVYSIYSAEHPDKEDTYVQITDKGLTNEEWAERLTEFFKKTGLYKDQPMNVARDEESFFDYRAVFEENFTKAHSGGQELSEQIQIERALLRDESMQRVAYARSFYSTLTVPADKIMPNEKQILSLELDDGVVEGISLVGIDSEKAKISIRSDEEYCLIGVDGKEKQISGDEIIKAVENRAEQESAKKTLTRNAGR